MYLGAGYPLPIASTFPSDFPVRVELIRKAC